MLHIIIPTLNAARTLPATLHSLGPGPETVWVCDGGSGDATLSVAMQAGAIPLSTQPGRGHQLATGAGAALAAGAGALLFLHADCRLPADWRQVLADHQQRAPERAAAFRLAFDDPHPAARLIAATANARSRWLGLPWGDQGLFLTATLYRQCGGYRPLPLMEDVEMIHRLGRDRVCLLPSTLMTDASRYRRDGWLRRPLKNAGLLALYALGVSPQRLARWYR